jgi:hypothetical protein
VERLQGTPFKKVMFLLLAPFMIPFLFGETTPYTLKGSDFLVFYLFLALASLTTWVIFYYNNKRAVKNLWQNNYKGDANVYQLSRFVFGKHRSVQAAIVDLAHQQILSVSNKHFLFHPGNYVLQVNETNPVIEGLMKKYKDDDKLEYENVEDCYDDDKAYRQDLSDIFKALSVHQMQVWLIPLAVLLIGFARVMQGLSNDRPVIFLLVMMFCLALFHAILYKFIQYKSLLESLVNAGYYNRELGNPFTVSSPVNQFVFMGLAGLGAYYSIENLDRIFDRKYESSSPGSSSSGCGSSCGGSCGGGCGGCGGGD